MGDAECQPHSYIAMRKVPGAVRASCPPWVEKLDSAGEERLTALVLPEQAAAELLPEQAAAAEPW
jgi:hypothetical protein